MVQALTLRGRRGLTVCFVMEVVFISMRFFGAIGDDAFVELTKWNLLGFFGAKGMEYLPKFGK